MFHAGRCVEDRSVASPWVRPGVHGRYKYAHETICMNLLNKIPEHQLFMADINMHIRPFVCSEYCELILEHQLFMVGAPHCTGESCKTAHGGSIS